MRKHDPEGNLPCKLVQIKDIKRFDGDKMHRSFAIHGETIVC
jgi:hypothetical protein